MKLFLLSNLYPSNEYPYYGTFVKQFEESITEHGGDIKVKVVLTKQPYLIKKIANYCVFFIKAIVGVFRGKYDLIYVHYANHSLLPLYFVLPFLKRPLVINAHGSDIFHESKYSKFVWFFAKRVIVKANLIVVPSSYFMDVIERGLNVSRNKIFISPSGGINFDKFKFSLKANKDNLLKIGYLGRIDIGKGYDTLLNAFSRLSNRSVIQHKLLVAGGGKEIDQFRALIKKNNISNSVDYKGFLSHDEVNDFLNSIDVLVFPSRRKGESLGLVPIEALACGKPVIAFNNGAVKDFILDCRNGFIYKKDDPDYLANKLEEFANLSMEQRKQMSIFAHETAKKYDSKYVGKVLYERLLLLISKK